MGKSFEDKWLPHACDVGDKALEVGDFSATADLYSVIANVYEINDVPFRIRDLTLLLGAVLAPFVPVALLIVPFDDIVEGLAKFLLPQRGSPRMRVRVPPMMGIPRPAGGRPKTCRVYLDILSTASRATAPSLHPCRTKNPCPIHN